MWRTGTSIMASESAKVSRIRTKHGVSRMPRLFARILTLYVVIPYVAVTAIFAVFQRPLMYRPTIASDLTASNCGLSSQMFQDVHLDLEKRIRLNGWLIRHQDVADQHDSYLVIYFPGNAGNRAERVADLTEIAAEGFDILIFDYRGFGDSGGHTYEAALTADANRIWDYATQTLKYDESHIILFGESLGGAVCLSVFSNTRNSIPALAAVILNSTFTSMSDVVGTLYPYFPFRYLLLDQWRSIDRIRVVNSPVIVFHGTADEMIPMEQGRTLAENCSSGRFIEIPGGTHNMIPTSRLKQELLRIRELATSRRRSHEPE